MRKLSCALLFFFVAATAQADWETVANNTEPGNVPGLEHRHLVSQDSATGDEAIVDLAIFSAKSCKLRIVDNPNGADLAEAMSQTNCVAGVNGGYFDPDFAPIGLRITDGRQFSPLIRARLLTGILVSSPRGIQILRLREFSPRAKIDNAIECGPMIVDLTAPVRGLDNTRSARRTFAAVDRGGRAAIGVCSNATLAELGEILAGTLASDFKIQRALNLDGGSSTAFWFKRQNGNALSISEQKNVRDFVAIVAR